MILETLTLRRYRNLAEAQLTFRPGLNVLWGANAQGKTNLLEAIHYLTTGRSFRTHRDEECLPFGAEPRSAARIQGQFDRNGTRHAVEVAITRQAKAIRVDDKPLTRLTELWGLVPVVLFTPGDLQMVTGGPAARREWLDVALSQSSRPYLDALKRFTRALRQRNALLRQPPPHSPSRAAQIAAYEAPLAEASGILWAARKLFVAELEHKAARRHAELSRNTETLELRYQHFLYSFAAEVRKDLDSLDARRVGELYRAELERLRPDDIQRAQTLVGPHRDDLLFLVNGREARNYASQGQARTIALSLRLAEVEQIHRDTGHAPLLLLDDILSELDAGRLHQLLSGLAQANQQTILTATDLEPLVERLSLAASWKVENGTVRPDAAPQAVP